MTRDDVQLESLSQVIRQEGRPVPINALTRAAVRAWLETTAAQRCYAPGAQYAQGETIQFNGQSVLVKEVRPGGNPKQGPFAILTLELPGGSLRHLAAGVPGAPTAERQPVTDEQVHHAIEADGLALRGAVRQALARDESFASFEHGQGEHWCLVAMLPALGEHELGKVAAVLQRELESGEPLSATTEQLVRAVWGEGDDGSPTYALRAFALGRALSKCSDVTCLCDHWMWAQAWQAFTEREPLLSPRMATHVEIPKGLAKPSDTEVDRQAAAEVEAEAGVAAEEERGDPEDLEEWRRNRSVLDVFTLSGRHYYEGWLPLNQDLRRLFPPFACGRQQVVFHHQFGGEPEFFPAWVDRNAGRIWVSPQMYETLRAHGIYPGARLRLAARNEREYDLATRPTDKSEAIRVWRMWLDDDGQIQYDDVQEPRRYDIDDDVFVADVRFEDREALFQQAQEAANSIFGLMYTQAVKWWEDQKRSDLYVSAQRLFDAIHYDPQQRMTYKVTIAWELWRRMAFQGAGESKYRFRPEFGGRVRFVESRRDGKPSAARHGPQGRKGPRLHEVTIKAQAGAPTEDLWAGLEADNQRMAALQAAVQGYMEDPAREKVLFLREVAHRRIRELLAKDRLGTLTLDEFNRQVWQIGSFQYEGQSCRIDTDQAEALLGRLGLEQFKEASKSGGLGMQGNQTWGSSSSVIGSRLRKSTAEMQETVRDTLGLLLYGEGPIEQRMEQVIREPNGFGMNVVTGVLHAVYPHEHILYNNRSVDALEKLGVKWPATWQRDVDTYRSYKGFCQQLRANLGFQSLSDVDWFMYRLAKGKVSFHLTGAGAARNAEETAPTQPTDRAKEERRQDELPLWQEVTKLVGRDLHTLDQGQAFHILDVSDESLAVWVGGTEVRTIDRRRIEAAWQHLLTKGELTRAEIRDRYSPVHSAYVAGILAALPGVTHQTNRIRLCYERTKVHELQLYSDYSRQQVHDILAPDTSFHPRGAMWGVLGIVPLGARDGDFAFFVTLGQKRAGHVFDEWITEDGVLLWQSQPKQSLDAPQIQQFIHHDERRHHIYLFLRTRKGIEYEYTYLGKLKYLWHDPQRDHPVYFRWQILNWHIAPAKLAEMGLQLRPAGQPGDRQEPVPAAIPDIGMRKVVYPIPFRHVQLPEGLLEERRWAKLLPARQLTLLPEPRTPDYLDQLLMQRIADKASNRFVTPREVVDFMVNLAQPKPGERVADICCGTGIFLVKALRFVKQAYDEDADLELCGVDIYDQAAEATRLNLLANGARHFTVVRGDSLHERGGVFGQKYDLILGNPPFGGGQDRSFLERWLELLQEDGRMAVNASEGTLAKSSAAHRDFRHWLVNTAEINLIASLPLHAEPVLYGEKSNVLLIRKAKPTHDHMTVLCDIRSPAEYQEVLQGI